MVSRSRLTKLVLVTTAVKVEVMAVVVMEVVVKEVGDTEAVGMEVVVGMEI